MEQFMKEIIINLAKGIHALSAIFLDWSKEAKKASDEAIKKRNQNDT